MTTVTYNPDQVKLSVQEEGILNFTTLEDLCSCGQEVDYGCHGVRDGEVYSEYLCKKCYNKREK